MELKYSLYSLKKKSIMISFDLRIRNKLIFREYFVSFPGKCDSSPSVHADNVNNKLIRKLINT